MSTDRLAVTAVVGPQEFHSAGQNTKKPRRASLLTGEWRRPLIVGATVLGLFGWLGFHLVFPDAGDTHAYFVANLAHLYGGREGETDAYLYSPAFAQATEPLRWLGWDAFRTIWRGLEVGALAVLTGPFVGLALFIAPVATEIRLGNINLLVGLAIAIGFRYPAAWSFVLLTKVTPGIGLLWFAVRREWRSLGIALGVTAGIAAVSFALAPASWFEWFTSLAGQTVPSNAMILVTAPFPLRVVAAAMIVTWGARMNRRWTVLVAAFLAMPVTAIWNGSVLIGLLWAYAAIPQPSMPDE